DLVRPGLAQAPAEPRVQIVAPVVVEVFAATVGSDQLQERVPAVHAVERNRYAFAGRALEGPLVGLAAGGDPPLHRLAQTERAATHDDGHAGRHRAAALAPRADGEGVGPRRTVAAIPEQAEAGGHEARVAQPLPDVRARLPVGNGVEETAAPGSAQPRL